MRTLWDPRPCARATDPIQSRVSAWLLEVSGRRDTQAGRILERLARGPATNVELADIALKYTGRVSDLRHEGWEIECETRRADGLTVYRLHGMEDR